MGLSSGKSKSVQKNEPWGPAKPYILAGLKATQDVFNQQQPDLNKYGTMQRDQYGRVSPGAEAGIMGGQNVINHTLAGDNLNGNPYLDKMLELTRANTTNTVNGQFESSGRYGSGQHAGILAGAIANAENGARFNNYAMERGYQQDAVGQAANYQTGAQGLLNNAAELPWIGVGAMNGNVRQASNGYGTQTTKSSQTQPWGPVLAQAASNAAQAAASGSDRRLKENIVKVDELVDGLGVYTYDYRQDTALILPKGRQLGVMADEVKALRPQAYIPNFEGSEYAGVDYAKLETV